MASQAPPEVGRDVSIPIGRVITEQAAAESPVPGVCLTYVTPRFAAADAIRKATHGPEMRQLAPELCRPPLPAGAGGAPSFAYSSPRPRSTSQDDGVGGETWSSVQWRTRAMSVGAAWRERGGPSFPSGARVDETPSPDSRCGAFARRWRFAPSRNRRCASSSRVGR